MNVKTVAADRRQNLWLRTIFDEVYDRIAPFLDPKQTWGGIPMEGLAFHMLRENYPGLSTTEARILVVALERVYLSRNPGQAARLLTQGGFGRSAS